MHMDIVLALTGVMLIAGGFALGWLAAQPKYKKLARTNRELRSDLTLMHADWRGMKSKLNRMIDRDKRGRFVKKETD